MDTRPVVPLRPMTADHQKKSMRDHLLAVEEIVSAAGAPVGHWRGRPARGSEGHRPWAGTPAPVLPPRPAGGCC